MNDKIEKYEVKLKLLRKQIKKLNTKPRYTFCEKLVVLWYMEYFDIPCCQITKRLGIAKSTLYRWFKEFDSIIKNKREPVDKISNELARLVWAVHNEIQVWGRHRISLQITFLGVFLSASTVRNILSRPFPPTNKKSNSEKTDEDQSRRIRSKPNIRIMYGVLIEQLLNKREYGIPMCWLKSIIIQEKSYAARR